MEQKGSVKGGYNLRPIFLFDRFEDCLIEDGGPKVQKRWGEIIASEEESDNPCKERQETENRPASYFTFLSRVYLKVIIR